jgi:hypothetical protein
MANGKYVRNRVEEFMRSGKKHESGRVDCVDQRWVMIVENCEAMGKMRDRNKEEINKQVGNGHEVMGLMLKHYKPLAANKEGKEFMGFKIWLTSACNLSNLTAWMSNVFGVALGVVHEVKAWPMLDDDEFLVTYGLTREAAGADGYELARDELYGANNEKALKIEHPKMRLDSLYAEQMRAKVLDPQIRRGKTRGIASPNLSIFANTTVEKGDNSGKASHVYIGLQAQEGMHVISGVRKIDEDESKRTATVVGEIADGKLTVSVNVIGDRKQTHTFRLTLDE